MRPFLLFLFSIIFSGVFAQSKEYNQWVENAANYIENNHLDSAAVALQNALACEPINKQNAALLLNLGVMQRYLRQYEDAYISLTASLANNMDSVSVLHQRAALLCDMNRFDEAMQDYNTILSIDSKNIEAYYRRGILFLDKKEQSKAQDDFNHAAHINPTHPFTLLSKALIYKLNDDWTSAEKIYSRLISHASAPNSGLYMNRAECYVNTEQFSKAATDLAVAQEKEKQNPYFYFLRGRVRLGQYDKLAAKEDFLKAELLGYDAQIVNEWLKKVK